MRALNLKALEEWRKVIKEGLVPVLIYDAPTGYGKSSIALELFAEAYENDLASRLIHAAPTRSLVEELYEKKYLRRLQGSPELARRVGVSNPDADIGFQAMSLLRSGKDPLFVRRIIATTIDSLFLNQFKVPVGGGRGEICYYELPRSSLASSMLVYDEAHLYGGDPGSPVEATYTMFIASLRSQLYEVPKPVAVMTATLPSRVLDDIVKYTVESMVGLPVKALRFRYGAGAFIDKEWEDMVLQIQLPARMVEEKALLRIIKEAVDQGMRVLVVMNKPGRAIEVYRKVKDLIEGEVVVVHGRMTAKDRDAAVKKLSAVKVLVATQVVEVGIDEDFDVLITDPAPPSQLVQRAGRICRWIEKRVNEGRIEGQVIIVKDGCTEPYSEDVVRETLSILSNKSVNWKGATEDPSRNTISSRKLIDLVYERVGSKVELRNDVFVALEELDHKLLLSHNHAAELFRDLCITTRGTLLVPLYVGSEPPFTLDELAKNCVPVNLEWLGAKNRFSKLLDVKEGLCKAFFLEQKRGEEPLVREELIELDVLKSCSSLMSAIMEKGLVAVKAKPEAYASGLGLLA